MSYARFLREHEHKFTYLRPVNGDCNSHMQNVDRYRGMVQRWQALGERYDLTGDEIAAITAH